MTAMPDSPESEPESITIGFIHKPIGLNGACAVTSYGRVLESLQLPHVVWLLFENGCRKHATLNKRKKELKGLRCGFLEYPDRTAAEELRNTHIAVSHNELPEADKNEFYHFELKEMRVYSDRGQLIGTVCDVFSLPTTDALEIRRLDGGGTFVIPFQEKFVPCVDRVHRAIRVQTKLIEELL